jgi:hypothetical protein
MCIALLGAYHQNSIGIDDPQFLGSAVSLIGLYLYVGGLTGLIRNTIILGVLIFAGLIKQTLFAIPIVIAVDLLLRHRREGMRFVVQAALMGTFVIFTLYFIFGYDFLEQLFAPRQYSIHAAATKTLRYPVVASAVLPLAISFLAIYMRLGVNRLVLNLLLSALAAGVFLIGAFGTGTNQFIDLAIALSIAAAVIVRCLRADLHAEKRLIMATILVAIYGPTLEVPYAIEQLRDGLSGSLLAAEIVFDEDLHFMAKFPGEALCDSLMLCFRGGREFFFDPFNASQAIKLGRLDASPLLAKVARGELAVIQLSTLEGHSLGPPVNGGPDVEREFRLILDQRYRIARVSGRRIFYVPR